MTIFWHCNEFTVYIFASSTVQSGQAAWAPHLCLSGKMADGKEKGNFFKKYCCFNKHDEINKATPLGKSVILAPNVKKSVLELLGSTDCEVLDKMKKMHSYIFDMGAGQYFENIEDAEDELIKRNFPDISNNCQQKAVFVPETFLPKVPRAVYPTEE